MEIEPHELRMITELAELTEKIKSLEIFVSSHNGHFVGICEEDKRLLKAQLNYMKGYRDMLQNRVVKVLKRIGEHL